MDNGASSYRRFLAGDDNGIAEIIRDYKDGLLLYLNGFVRNIHVAEELTEDTFVKIAVKKPRFSQKSSFKTWLYVIGRNVAIDHLRKNRRVSISSADELASILRDEGEVERDYIKNENKIMLHGALKRLNPEYCRVLYLIYFEGFDNAEAAKIMNKNKRQIENLLYRAKGQLKEELRREGFVYEIT